MTSKQEKQKKTFVETLHSMKAEDISQEYLDKLQRRYRRRSNKMTTRMLAKLEHTALFYMVNDRAEKEDEEGRTACVYSPFDNSPGCAIGHDVSKELAAKMDIVDCFGSGTATISTVFESELYDELPAWMTDFDPLFLKEIQSFHDMGNNWYDEGDRRKLSSMGSLALNRIYTNIFDYYVKYS